MSTGEWRSIISQDAQDQGRSKGRLWE